jgi:hypothetical protein
MVFLLVSILVFFIMIIILLLLLLFLLGLGSRKSRHIITPKQLVQRALIHLLEEEAVDLFREHFGRKYIIKKRKNTGMKEETEGGGSLDLSLHECAVVICEICIAIKPTMHVM